MTERDLKAFLQQPFSSINQRTLLINLFGDTLTEFTQPRILVENTDTVRLGQQIGLVTLSDGRNLALIDVTVTDAVLIARNRKGLRDVAAKYIDQSIVHGALVFYHGAVYSLFRRPTVLITKFLN